MRGAPLSPDAMRLSWGLLRLANGSTIRPRCGARSKPPRTPKRRRSRGRSRVGSWRTYRLRVLSQRFPSLLPLKPSGVTAGLCHWFPDVDLRRDPRSSPGRDRPETLCSALGCPAPRVASPPVQFPGGDVPGERGPRKIAPAVRWFIQSRSLNTNMAVYSRAAAKVGRRLGGKPVVPTASH
jgi:hypothetical protein